MTDRFPVRLEALDLVLQPVPFMDHTWAAFYEVGSTDCLDIRMHRDFIDDEVHFEVVKHLGEASAVHAAGSPHADLDTAWCQMRDVAHEWSPRLYKMIVQAEYMAAEGVRARKNAEEEMPI